MTVENFLGPFFSHKYISLSGLRHLRYLWLLVIVCTMVLKLFSVLSTLRSLLRTARCQHGTSGSSGVTWLPLGPWYRWSIWKWKVTLLFLRFPEQKRICSKQSWLSAVLCDQTWLMTLGLAEHSIFKERCWRRCSQVFFYPFTMLSKYLLVCGEMAQGC
jgi:hypothetical protein